MSISGKTTGRILHLSGSLDIGGAEEARTLILEHLGAGTEVVLDLEGVEACDAAGAQLLLSAIRAFDRAHTILRFHQLPPSVLGCWARLGLPDSVLPPSST